jgi:hypothetical protein
LRRDDAPGNPGNEETLRTPRPGFSPFKTLRIIKGLVHRQGRKVGERSLPDLVSFPVALAQEDVRR